jgi:hypothetical protein
LKLKAILPKYSIWKVNQVEHYFKRVSDTEWIEAKDGIYYARFELINQNDNLVTIYKVDGNIYVDLMANSSNLLLFGKWII